MYAFREINVSDCRNAIVMSRNLTSKSRLHAATANETRVDYLCIVGDSVR
jgi:hypothetical protein